jgi:hypothetical protein
MARRKCRTPRWNCTRRQPMHRKGNMTLQPAYSATEKLKQFALDSKGLQKLTAALLELHAKDIKENIPLYIVNKLPPHEQAGSLPQHPLPRGYKLR